MDDFLMHYGRKGMKWGQHIFGDQKETAKHVKNITDTVIKSAEDLWRLSDEFDVVDKELSSLSKKTIKTLAERKRIKELNKVESDYVKKFNETAERGHEALNKLLDDSLDDNEDADKAVETLMKNPKVWTEWFLEYYTDASMLERGGIPKTKSQIDYWETLKKRAEYGKNRKAVKHSDDFLMHYGRRGMKWYQHVYGEVQSQAKYASKGGSSKDSGPSKTGVIKRISSAVKGTKAKEQNVRKLSDISDDELRKLISRAQLEKQYKDLNPRKVSAGEQIVKRVLVPVMEQQAKNLLNAKLSKMVENLSKDSKQSSGRVEDMSYEDLKKAVSRGTLEEQYRKLKANKS